MAYLAGGWLLLQVLDVVGDAFEWPLGIQRGAVVVVAVGFLVTLVVASFHGEKGRQRVSGPELLIIAGLCLAGAFGVDYVRRDASDLGDSGPPAGEAQASSRPDPRSVAVLPFLDLSETGDQEYFGDGIAEELLNALAQISDLKVAGRTSSFAFKGSTLEIREIASRLGVASVLAGSVRRSATQLRINAELVDAADGRRRWNRQYDRELSDIFAVQEDIARAIAAEFRLELAGGADDLTLRGQTDDHEAQDLYLEGRFEWNRRTRESLEDAVRLFEQALARDDGYARAHVGLGDANAVLGFYEYRRPGDAFPAAQRAARAALALEPRLAEPHATLGYVALYHDWDWDTAQREFLEAIRVSPDYPVAHQWYANYLTAMGRPSEAEAEMRRASELDPLSMIAHAATGWVLYYAGEQTRARTQLEESKLRDPEFEPAHLWSAWVDEELGELAAAERSARRAVELSGGSTISRATLARVLARQGRVEESRALVAELESERDRGGYVPSYDIARVYVALDDPAAALAWLERARDDRSHSMAFLQVDPQLASLHDEPRFVALAEALGLGHGP